MEILQKLKKEPRPIISILLLLFFFLPWLSDAANFSMDLGEFGSFDTGFVESGLYSGFDLFGVTYLSLILPFLPLLLLAVEFLPVLRKYKKIIYPIASILGIIGTIVVIIVTSITITSFSLGLYDSEITYRIGFYLSIIAYVVQLVLTIIIDFKINNKTLKEQGLKGALGNISEQVVSSVGEMKENIQSGDLKNAMIEQISSLGNGVAQKTPKATMECPSCKASVIAGKKFCNKCGYKFEVNVIPVTTEPIAYAHQEAVVENKNNSKTESNSSSNNDNKNISHSGVSPVTVSFFKCEYCSGEIPQGKKYCPDCGKKVEDDKPCNNCGAIIPKGKKFCADCGAPAPEPKKDVICGNCGANISEGKKFCSDCGTPTEYAKRICKACGAELEEGKRFCFDCGAEYIK